MYFSSHDKGRLAESHLALSPGPHKIKTIAPILQSVGFWNVI